MQKKEILTITEPGAVKIGDTYHHVVEWTFNWNQIIGFGKKRAVLENRSNVVFTNSYEFYLTNEAYQLFSQWYFGEDTNIPKRKEI